jgi:DNA-binding response OmpR family regulator
MTDIKKTLLLVSADQTATGSLEKLLELNGYRTCVATTVASALSEIRVRPPVLLLLDRQILANEGGRRDQFPFAIPIIVLQPFDKCCGQDECLSELDAGFDLVFCSPHYRELLAHIRAILRRHTMPSTPPSALRVEGLMMDIARHEVTVGGTLVDLTPKEFRILHQFLLSPGVVLSRQELLNRVWGEDYALEEHALDVHIHSLRQKIEADSSKPRFVVTIRGIGYKLQAS